MKGRTTIIVCVVCVVGLFAALEYGHAEPQTAVSASKIGVLSIRNVFNGSQKHAVYRSQVLADQSRSRAQLEDLNKEIQAEEAGLGTLKPGTEDHLKQLQAVLQKRAQLQTQQEYLKQQRSIRDKAWMERLYQATLKIVEAVAKEKGLDLVLERTEPEFPISSEELMMTFSSHKVLFGGGCVDLTAEVTARLDASEEIKP
ncbi:MAG: OmpH family outer membrane protein [Sedimentisphaerales bacterium]|nr:OmpH family outer membrane protein [Sedimentisphaerales bacterium]